MGDTMSQSNLKMNGSPIEKVVAEMVKDLSQSNLKMNGSPINRPGCINLGISVAVQSKNEWLSNRYIYSAGDR